jgi:ABC-2 type transport system permease protein
MAAIFARPWRAARITPMAELSQPTRLTSTAVRLAVQIALVTYLWRALYSGVESSAGLDRQQATTYAIMAVLATQIRSLDRSVSGDTVPQHVESGSILYWFLRPVSPRRYHVIRAVGDQLYGFAWVVAGYVICLSIGIVTPPPTGSAAAAFAVSMMLGQIVMYRLLLIVDLLCFWTTLNNSAVAIMRFVQDLLSGVFAPLWFFPTWFGAISAVLPFQGTLNVPLSLYIGRIEIADAAAAIAVQLIWCVLLTLVTSLMWRRVADRIVVQGG